MSHTRTPGGRPAFNWLPVLTVFDIILLNFPVIAGYLNLTDTTSTSIPDKRWVFPICFHP